MGEAEISFKLSRKGGSLVTGAKSLALNREGELVPRLLPGTLLSRWID